MNLQIFLNNNNNNANPKRSLDFCFSLNTTSLLAHRWSVSSPPGSASTRWFKRISLTGILLACINHNKNGTCGLSSLKDQLPGDTAETSPIICPSEAETIGKSIERISVPEGKISGGDKKYSALYSRVYVALRIQSPGLQFVFSMRKHGYFC